MKIIKIIGMIILLGEHLCSGMPTVRFAGIKMVRRVGVVAGKKVNTSELIAVTYCGVLTALTVWASKELLRDSFRVASQEVLLHESKKITKS